MGSENSTVAINEIVFFLSRTDPSGLEDLRQRYPQLAGELKEGIYAGPEEDIDRNLLFLRGKAELAMKALSNVLPLSEKLEIQIENKISRAKKKSLVESNCCTFRQFIITGNCGT